MPGERQTQEREDRFMITLYSYPSPNGHKASIMLEETGLPYETVRVDITTGENLKPDFLAISPLGKIPALIDHDVENAPRRVFGSGAILEYLGEKTGKFLPREVCARTEVWNWLAFGVSDVGPTSVDMFRFAVRAPEKLPYAIELFKSELHRCYQALESQLSKTEYLVDSKYTIADIAVFPFITIASQTAPTLFEKYPGLKRWHGLVSARPAVQRGMSMPE
jgi:GSH-dependent disulfide-bond oxidoreductase